MINRGEYLSIGERLQQTQPDNNVLTINVGDCWGFLYGFEELDVGNLMCALSDEKYFYTVREQDISYHANTILKNVKVTALSKIEWRDVIRGGCFGADCLIVFETGPSNTALDILSGIREREPSVFSIISVILCTNNSTDHDRVCSSIENHTFTTEKDISFEVLMFSDGRIHECSRNIAKIIESQLIEIQGKTRKREENTSRVRPAIYSKMRSRLEELLAKIKEDKRIDLEDTITNLDAVITQFKEQKLEQSWHLTEAKDCLEKMKLEKGLKDAIRKRGGFDEAIENTEKSKFKETLRTLICQAEQVREVLKKKGKCTYPIPKWTPEIITELRRYKRPPQVIHDIVLAAFILLGETKDNLQDWETIRYQMGPQRKPALWERVKDFTGKKQMKITEDTKAEINGILQNHLLDSVRQVSSGAATIYDWIRNYIPVEEHY